MNEIGIVIMGDGKVAALSYINLRSQDYSGRITLVSDESLLPYDRPPLSKASISDPGAHAPLLLLDDDIVKSVHVDVKLGMKIVSINRVEKAITLADDLGSGLTNMNCRFKLRALPIWEPTPLPAFLPRAQS